MNGYLKTILRTRENLRGRWDRLVLPAGMAMLMCAGLTWVGWLVAARSEQTLWEERSRPAQSASATEEGKRYLTLNTPAMGDLLDRVPAESGDGEVELPLPMPDGSIVRFQIVEAPVLAPELAAKYPEIRTYAGRSSDESGATMRGMISRRGFEAFVLRTDGLVSIRPAGDGQGDLAGAESYVSVDEQLAQSEAPRIRCEVRDDGSIASPDAVWRKNLENGAVSIGGALRTYRLALGATWEYAERFGGGTVAGTVAAMASLLNRANAIYERELAIRFLLVDAPSLIHSTEQGFSAATDPFTVGNANANLPRFGQLMLSFGGERYDVGHLLDWGASGVANVGVACRNPLFAGELFKALGVSALSHDLGEKGNLNLFVHELGHQFGAKHSFNGTASACGFNGERAPDAAFEPGSGSTIMSYGGLCGSDDLTSYASGSIRFHFGSVAQILSYVETVGGCFNPLGTSNIPPVVDGGPDYVIPRQTPFELRATGTDGDSGDRPALTYVWDQIDPGLAQPNPPYTDRDDPPETTRPLFRSYEPSSNGSRLFPGREYILNNANMPPEMSGGYRVAESLPTIGRVLNFGVMLRDNRSGGSGLSLDRVVLNVAASAGPFRISSLNNRTEWLAGTDLPILWEVASSDLSPVNCREVQISLSLDGGQTFPLILNPATPNDGQETVRLPAGKDIPRARIRVAAVGNIFFDINDADLNIRHFDLPAPPRPRPSSGAVDRPNRLGR